MEQPEMGEGPSIDWVLYDRNITIILVGLFLANAFRGYKIGTLAGNGSTKVCISKYSGF